MVSWAPCCIVYLDDIIFGPDLATFVENLRKVFTRLSEAHFRVNLPSVISTSKPSSIVGYQISADRIRPSPHRTEAVLHLQSPC